MDILTIIDAFNFHDSPLYNIAYNSHKNELILTIDLCNWAQVDFKKDIDPDHIIGNLIFKNVQDLFLDPSQFNFKFQEILEVSCEGIANGAVKVTFIVTYKEKNSSYMQGDPNFLLSFNSSEVRWVPLESYFD